MIAALMLGFNRETEEHVAVLLCGLGCPGHVLFSHSNEELVGRVYEEMLNMLDREGVERVGSSPSLN